MERQCFHRLDHLEGKVRSLEEENERLRAAIFSLTDDLIERDRMIEFVKSEIIRMKGE